MKYTATMLQEQLDELVDGFENSSRDESAAYLFCNISTTKSEKRLIVRKVQILQGEEIESRSPRHISIKSQSYVKALADADKEELSLILVHSHPGGYANFSTQDDSNEHDFFKTAYIRAPKGLHGSIILTESPIFNLIGRVWLDEDNAVPMSRIRVVGRRFRVFDYDNGHSKPNVNSWSDRQIRAFSKDIQVLLNQLHIGVVEPVVQVPLYPSSS